MVKKGSKKATEGETTKRRLTFIDLFAGCGSSGPVYLGKSVSVPAGTKREVWA